MEVERESSPVTFRTNLRGVDNRGTGKKRVLEDGPLDATTVAEPGAGLRATDFTLVCAAWAHISMAAAQRLNLCLRSLGSPPAANPRRGCCRLFAGVLALLPFVEKTCAGIGGRPREMAQAPWPLEAQSSLPLGVGASHRCPGWTPTQGTRGHRKSTWRGPVYCKCNLPIHPGNSRAVARR